jgi:hypothetical protein
MNLVSDKVHRQSARTDDSSGGGNVETPAAKHLEWKAKLVSGDSVAREQKN